MSAEEHKNISAVTKPENPSGLGDSRPKGAMTNAGWNAFFTLWSIAISFLLAPVLIHFLGTAQYGILLLVWSITGILGIASFGLGEATLRYVSYHYGDRDLPGVNRVFGSTLSFYAVVCAVIAAVLFVAAPTVAAFLKIPASEHRLVGWLLRLSAVVFSLGIFSRAFGAIPMALQRYDISSKINIGQSVVRSVGYILLVVYRFGILHLVIWDVATYICTLAVQVAVIRKLAPGVRLLPSFSFRGLREIIGYSVYSLLTYVFYTMFRESGKLVLGRYLGTSPVAYLGTPDNVAQRVHMLVASSSETLLPRFSANRDPKVARALFLGGTWAALAVSIVFFIPMVVLMPDFLRLWINPQFSLESAAVGQLLALSYITQGAYAPTATYFRGIGRPWAVSIVLFFAGIGTLLAGILLVPAYGVLGAGYAYLIGSAAHFLGLLCGWFYIFGRSSMSGLMRSVGMPLLLAGVAFALESAIRGRFPEVNWIGLFTLGGLFVGITTLLVIGVDWVIGGDSPSKRLFERIGESDKVRQLLSYIPAWRVR
jgi:O-antigen/teichoic acid export membrane protein